MNNSLYSNKIDQLYRNIHSGGIDNNKIIFYRTTIKDVNKFQKEKTNKIEKLAQNADGKLKIETLDKCERKPIISLSDAKDSINKSNILKQNISSVSKIKDEEMNLYEYDMRNFNANIKKKVEQVTKKIAERYYSAKDNRNVPNLNSNNTCYSSFDLSEPQSKNKIKTRNIILKNSKNSRNKERSSSGIVKANSEIIFSISRKGVAIFNNIDNDKFEKLSKEDSGLSNQLNLDLQDKSNYNKFYSIKKNSLKYKTKESSKDETRKVKFKDSNLEASETKIIQNDYYKISNNSKNIFKTPNKSNNNLLIKGLKRDQNNPIQLIDLNHDCYARNVNNHYQSEEKQLFPALKSLDKNVDYRSEKEFLFNSEKKILMNNEKSKLSVNFNGVDDLNNNGFSFNKNEKTGDDKNFKKNIQRKSILKNSSNNTFKSASTALPIQNDLTAPFSLIKDSGSELDNPYGINSYLKNNSNNYFKSNREEKLHDIKEATDYDHFQDDNSKSNSSFTPLININKNNAYHQYEDEKNKQSNLKNDHCYKVKITKDSTNSDSAGSEKSIRSQNILPYESPIKFNKKDKNEALKIKRIYSTRNLIKIDDSLIDGKILLKINKSVKKPKIPVFKSYFKLNNHLIRDFTLGNISNPKDNSRKRYNMTEKFFQYKDKILHEIKYNENLNEIGYQSEIKNLEYFIEQNSKSDINENKDNEEQETLEAQKNKYLKAQEVLDKREMERTFEKTKDMVNQILELNNESYESFNSSLDIKINKISKRNIEKVVKLKRILKNNVMDEMDFITDRKANKVRKIKEETQDILTLTLHKLGPPSFLKTKFKNQTIKKYQTVNGKYFGC